MTVIVTIVTVTHMPPHMCRAPPKPSPTPSPQPTICIYCGSSDHRSMECSNHPQDNREEGHAPSPAANQYNWEKQ